MKTLVRFAVVVAALAAGKAGAQGPCRGDIEKFCAGIPPGGGRILACLKSNANQLSQPCKAHVEEVRQKAKEFGDACEGDVYQFCQGIRPGKGRMLACLNSNVDRLSPPCRDRIQAAREKAAGFQEACGPDAARLCQGIPPGQGRILACLKSREAELSPACRAAMQR
jgi:Golgi apparatus protein 1